MVGNNANKRKEGRKEDLATPIDVSEVASSYMKSNDIINFKSVRSQYKLVLWQ